MKRPLVDLGLGRAARRHGIALVLTLGILSLLLITCMAFAFSAQLDRTTAKVRSEQTSAGLLSDAALQRVVGFMTREFAGEPYPADLFYGPSGNDWDVTDVLFSWRPETPNAFEDSWDDYTWGANSGPTGLNVDSAMYVRIGGGEYTPDELATGGATSLSDLVSWIPVLVPGFNALSDTGFASSDFDDSTIIGRYAYVIRDHTGQLDPSWLVDTTFPIGSRDDETVVSTGDGDGAHISFISLEDAGLPSAVSDDLVAGCSPALPWLSYQHIFKASANARSNSDDVVGLCFPHTIADKQQYWRINPTTGDTDLLDRQDLTTLNSLTAAQIYNLLMGYSGDKTDYAATMADTMTLSPWLRNLAWEGVPAGSDTETELRLYAAQMAVILKDYVDNDSDISGLAVDGTGAVTARAPSAGPDATKDNVWGIEPGIGLSEIHVKLDCVRDDFDGEGGSEGQNDLEVTPGFAVELYDPFGSTGYAVEVEIDYTLEVAGGGGPISNTVVITNAEFAKSGGFYTAGGAGTYLMLDTDLGGTAHQFDDCAGPAPPQWTLNAFSIDKVIVRRDGTEVREYPTKYRQNNARFFMWGPETGNRTANPAGGVNSLYGDVGCADAMFNDRAAEDYDFDIFWASSQGLDSSAPFDMQDMGTVDNSASIGTTTNPGFVLGYGSAAYGDISEPPNGAFTRLHELGRVHSAHSPNQSVRLWSFDSSAPNYLDAYLLDMFNIGGRPTQGTINLNTRFNGVLDALFTGVFTTVAETDARAALQAVSGTGVFLHRGDIHKMFADGNMSGEYADAADDNQAEEDLGQFIEFTQVRDQYYGVITAAQVLKDLGPTNGTSPYDPTEFDNSVQWRRDGGTDWHALVYGQRQELIILYRDGWTGDIRILRRDVMEGE